jgi:hypothetical protein
MMHTVKEKYTENEYRTKDVMINSVLKGQESTERETQGRF